MGGGDCWTFAWLDDGDADSIMCLDEGEEEREEDGGGEEKGG